MGQGRSRTARNHALIWSDASRREQVVREMYALRFKEISPYTDINALRGIEGSRVKETYRIEAERYGVRWHGRRYDRSNPDAADIPNQAINHMATFVEAAADVATAAVGALPPLGFVHEDSSNAFVLDIADLYRADLTIPTAFRIARQVQDNPGLKLESTLRAAAADEFRRAKLIDKMIDRVKELLRADDGGGDA
jgi:CRISP-associated protein Cas1